MCIRDSSLDEHITDEVHKMKKNTFKILGVTDFAAETTFREPCLTLVLRDLVCEQCFYIADLDIFRQRDALGKQWLCPSCSQPYDKRYVETRLVQHLSEELISLNVQDLYCRRCKMIREDALASNCACGGEYDFMRDYREKHVTNFESLVQNLQKLAATDDFENLKLILRQLMSNAH
eukprot:TRINITY_DN4116_c0_g2_i10.p1 TRINITY_DN4116_c0_g2~~TRINITY_DN4116_c0_g2_i10.p1  ORF type:complete len:177 (-),score=46.80 TRINITY_DN4116_c0_g2_i10:125-655(-)